MCGILFELSSDDCSPIATSGGFLYDHVIRRGPDACHTAQETTNSQLLTFTSSVLHLRGSCVVVQPLEDPNGNILCWNGEAWSGLDMTLSENDTQALSKKLADHPDRIAEVLIGISGPYALVYYQKDRNKLWFSRDRLGRRSLLRSTTASGFILCSVGDRNYGSWQEISSGLLHCYNLKDRSETIIPLFHDESSQELSRAYLRINCTLPSNFQAAFKTTQHHDQIIQDFRIVLTRALEIRTKTLPGFITTSDEHVTPRIAIMYSGGVDCAVLARLMHDVLEPGEPVDLLNVSFENPRTIANARKIDPAYADIYSTPDRLTGRQGFLELTQACPRAWRFIEIDVPYEKAQSVKDLVLDLMFPNSSVMDHSIALAFYFCAQGIGSLDGEPCSTTARVYFSGLGADEQLGGYSRHIAAYKSGHHEKLIEELQLDLDRIPSRNLGRDDRVLAAFGREVRWPFLDESVIGFLSNLRVDQKMDFTKEGGDKLLLRDLGRHLGIPKASAEKKRAIQFGSRTARMEHEHRGGQANSGRVLGHQTMK